MLMTDNGMIFQSQADTNLPKMKVHKRQLTKSKTILQNIFQSAEENEENDPKTKNIRQTEIVVDLRNAILQICKHFATCSEAHETEILVQADYSPESHENDRENFLKARREGRKRAKALLDFQRQEEDELGFNKNDIITIVSETDEHCWVGEINGCRGWFPAKFVEVIDERGKNYCINGDEAVDSKISDLVRGPLAMAFRRIMFHGIRESSRMISSFVSHPWPFIESLSASLVENHNSKVNSRLSLCDAFKLDQDGKVLSPEELLYRAVQDINFSHNAANAQLDVKLRSLLAYALNEQCLHLWFEIFCDSSKQDDIRKRYFHSSSFIRTPAWKHIKCELRLLAQCAFNLNVDSEIAIDEIEKSSSANGIGRIRLMSTKKAQEHAKKSNGTVAKQPLKEGVRDMLIKHHLFSWDL
uniref:Uncharacterized protein n=1 Tax=Acrobeloides nanus TaxID=290746 RepID=A0A914CUA2_9BILA